MKIPSSLKQHKSRIKQQSFSGIEDFDIYQEPVIRSVQRHCILFTNRVTRQAKRENSSLPVGVLGSKTSRAETSYF